MQEFAIATGRSRSASKWHNEVVSWDDFISSLKRPKRTSETMVEYASMPQEKRTTLKDVGGFVAGSLKDGVRKVSHVAWRSMITLDLDNVDISEAKALEIIETRCPYQWVIYPTHSHRPEAPRLRLIIPLETTITEDQYEPVARRIAADIDIDWVDTSSYRSHQLMFWPSVPADLDYDAVFRVHEGPLAHGTAILQRYTDWHNVAEWPQSGKEADHVKRLAKQQSNPLEKDNIIGVFCRSYDIHTAISTFLSDIYVPTGKDNRYTYTGGSTVGGLVIYDDVFAYDNHATSPASGMLCNAFDLVRVHKFGELDHSTGSGVDPTKRPSFQAMSEFAAKDEKVHAEMAKEREEKIKNDFIFDKIGDDLDENDAENWQNMLVLDKNGIIAKTIENVRTILLYDPWFRGKLYTDIFAERSMVAGALPWDDREKPRDWSDKDAANLRLYLEKFYYLSGKDRINDGIDAAFTAHRIHPVREYLKNLPEWDEIPRVEGLLVDYLGALDTPYVRAVTKTHLVAAVARVMQPGVKYDTMITLCGEQGVYKSTLIRLLCGDEWFTDNLRDFRGKEPFELIQGNWMVEIGEMSAYRKAEKEEFKAFLSKTSDSYRPAYGRNTVRQPRQCVFWGTTNDKQFLRDETGERRNWPVEVGEVPCIKDVWKDLPEERDQIWAEVMQAYNDNWPLILSPDIEQQANEERKGFKEEDPRRDQIVEFLETEIPENWYKLSLDVRRDYYFGDYVPEGVEMVKRDHITAVEIWVECFRRSETDFLKKDAAEINLILGNMPGWKRQKKQVRLDKVVYGGARRLLSYVRKEV